MLHRCSRYGMASCFPSHGSSGSRGMQRVLPQCDIGELFFPSLLVLSLWMSKGHAPMVDESGRPVTPRQHEQKVFVFIDNRVLCTYKPLKVLSIETATMRTNCTPTPIRETSGYPGM